MWNDWIVTSSLFRWANAASATTASPVQCKWFAWYFDSQFWIIARFSLLFLCIRCPNKVENSANNGPAELIRIFHVSLSQRDTGGVCVLFIVSSHATSVAHYNFWTDSDRRIYCVLFEEKRRPRNAVIEMAVVQHQMHLYCRQIYREKLRVQMRWGCRHKAAAASVCWTAKSLAEQLI